MPEPRLTGVIRHNVNATRTWSYVDTDDGNSFRFQVENEPRFLKGDKVSFQTRKTSENGFVATQLMQL